VISEISILRQQDITTTDVCLLTTLSFFFHPKYKIKLRLPIHMVAPGLKIRIQQHFSTLGLLPNFGGPINPPKLTILRSGTIAQHHSNKIQFFYFFCFDFFFYCLLRVGTNGLTRPGTLTHHHSTIVHIFLIFLFRFFSTVFFTVVQKA
jgi:hypothetical protein